MTTNQLKERLLSARGEFYSWKAKDAKEAGKLFRCHHIEPYPLMSEDQCQARAARPDIYRNAGCSNRCPRWRHYRRQYKKNQKLPERRPYPHGWKEGDPR